MKATRIRIAIIVLIVFHASAVLSQSVGITIDDIVANQQIVGRVLGLTPTDYPNYKVVVYVHTDKWYIHPYAGQDEGQSWASIKTDGTWKLNTVQRQFKADKVAALLVKRNYPEPNKIEDENLEKVQHGAIIIKELRGTPHYGKL